MESKDMAAPGGGSRPEADTAPAAGCLPVRVTDDWTWAVCRLGWGRGNGSTECPLHGRGVLGRPQKNPSTAEQEAGTSRNNGTLCFDTYNSGVCVRVCVRSRKSTACCVYRDLSRPAACIQLSLTHR